MVTPQIQFGFFSGLQSLWPRVSNSNCFVGHMRTYKVTCGPHYDADTAVAVPELTSNSFYILFPAKGVINFRQIISSRLSHSY